MRLSSLALMSALTAGIVATPALAQDPAPRDVRDLIGSRAAGGETQLERRGYRFVKVETGTDRKWANWWNPRTHTCLSVVTYDGRYDSIVTAPALDCEQRERREHRSDRSERSHGMYDGFSVLRLKNGKYQASDTEGCTVYFNDRGGLLSAMPDCDIGQKARASVAVLQFRRANR